MSYQREIPRDLFNESKLLKCLGQLSLIIHDGFDKANFSVPRSLTIEHDDSEESGFKIVQDGSSGDISCSNIHVRFNDEKIDVHSLLNDKDPYPLYFEDYEEGECPVFNNDGTLSEEFIEVLSK